MSSSRATDLHLNLGCGDHKHDGWLNIDLWPGAGPDVVSNLTALPFPDRSVDRLYAGHVLEHLPLDQVPAALAEMRRVLRGHLCVVGPDLDRATATGDEALISAVRDGGHRWPGDEHRWPSTETSTLALIREAFPEAQPTPVGTLRYSGWPVDSYVDWQFAVTT